MHSRYRAINGNSNLIERPDLLKDSGHRTGTNRSMVSLHEYASEITETARYNLRDVRHENVNAFIGFYDDQQTPAIILDFCSRGSLEDVLNNHDIKLDWDFKVSLLTDLIRGVRYIHNSSLRWHGNLKCRNCLIDSRWVLKVSDFGLPSVYTTLKQTLEFTETDLLCMAPEHLRDPTPGMKGSEKGDVYSIAIIMQCVVLRSSPYSTTGLTPREILQKLKHPPPLLRPSVSHGTAPPQYIQLMKVCWTENPEMRPGMEEIYQQFKTFTGGKKMNIVDTMFRMLEKYSTDLEDLVKDRTLQLEEEKKKTDLLLYRMLPEVVADSLKFGRSVPAEQFSEVTIYFSDIVGFTTISAKSTPMQVVDLLNGLYTMFDATIDAYDVYKVETIGDAYMVCSGLPVRNENRHAGEISTMALDLLSQCGNFTIKHMPEVPLRVRIGLHSGPCVAGVVGLTMPRYCLFGDTVNTASRMESTGAAYRIHISEAVRVILESLGGYQTEYRGEVELKGKGMAKTYWLIGKESFTKELPKPPPISGLSLDEFTDHSKSKTSNTKEKPPLRRITSNSVLCEDTLNKGKRTESGLKFGLGKTLESKEENKKTSVRSECDKPKTINVVPTNDVKDDVGLSLKDTIVHEHKSDESLARNECNVTADKYRVKSEHLGKQSDVVDLDNDINAVYKNVISVKETNSTHDFTIQLHSEEQQSTTSCGSHNSGKHVTFKRNSLDEILDTKDDLDEHVNDVNRGRTVSSSSTESDHVCDMHDINLNTQKHVKRHTKPSPRRINVSPGFQQSRGRKVSDASEDIKIRRPSYQESLV
ncbi:Retinal guanylyl cyclase 1 [Mactra antiquata]